MRDCKWQDTNDVKVHDTPSGNVMMECRADLPDDLDPPDRALRTTGEECETPLGVTTDTKKVITPAGKVHLTCRINGKPPQGQLRGDVCGRGRERTQTAKPVQRSQHVRSSLRRRSEGEAAQEPLVVLHEQPEVVDSVAHHRDPVDSEPEGETRMSFRVDPHGFEHRGMDHPGAPQLEPARTLAEPAAITPAQDALISTSVSSISWIMSLINFSGSSALSSMAFRFEFMISQNRVKIPILSPPFFLLYYA